MKNKSVDKEQKNKDPRQRYFQDSAGIASVGSSNNFSSAKAASVNSGKATTPRSINVSGAISSFSEDRNLQSSKAPDVAHGNQSHTHESVRLSTHESTGPMAKKKKSLGSGFQSPASNATDAVAGITSNSESQADFQDPTQPTSSKKSKKAKKDETAVLPNLSEASAEKLARLRTNPAFPAEFLNTLTDAQILLFPEPTEAQQASITGNSLDYTSGQESEGEKDGSVSESENFNVSDEEYYDLNPDPDADVIFESAIEHLFTPKSQAWLRGHKSATVLMWRYKCPFVDMETDFPRTKKHGEIIRSVIIRYCATEGGELTEENLLLYPDTDMLPIDTGIGFVRCPYPNNDKWAVYMDSYEDTDMMEDENMFDWRSRGPFTYPAPSSHEDKDATHAYYNREKMWPPSKESITKIREAEKNLQDGHYSVTREAVEACQFSVKEFNRPNDHTLRADLYPFDIKGNYPRKIFSDGVRDFEDEKVYNLRQPSEALRAYLPFKIVDTWISKGITSTENLDIPIQSQPGLLTLTVMAECDEKYGLFKTSARTDVERNEEHLPLVRLHFDYDNLLRPPWYSSTRTREVDDFELVCYYGMSAERYLEYYPWFQRMHQLSLPTLWKEFFNPLLQVPKWGPSKQLNITRRTALLQFRSLLECRVNITLIDKYHLPPVNFSKHQELIAFYFQTCPQMLYALVFGKESNEDANSQPSREMQEMMCTVEILLELVKLPWCVDELDRFAYLPSAKWNYDNKGCVVKLNVRHPPMSNVRFKAVLLRAYTTQACELLTYARQHYRASAALWRRAVEALQHRYVHEHGNNNQIEERFGKWEAHQDSVHVFIVLQKKTDPPVTLSQSKAANAKPLTTPFVADQTDDSNLIDYGTDDLEKKDQDPSNKDATNSRPSDAISNIGSAGGNGTGAPPYLHIRTKDIVLDKSITNVPEFWEDGRLIHMDWEITQALINYVAKHEQQQLVPMLMHLFSPKFDDKVWNTLARVLLATKQKEFTATQVEKLKTHKIAAFADDIKSLLEILTIKFNPLNDVVDKSRTTNKIKAKRALEDVLPIFTKGDPKEGIWFAFIEKIKKVYVDLKTVTYLNEPWEDPEYQKDLLTELIASWTRIWTSHPEKYQLFYDLVERMREKQCHIQADGVTTIDIDSPKTMEEFFCVMTLFNDEQAKEAMKYRASSAYKDKEGSHTNKSHHNSENKRHNNKGKESSKKSNSGDGQSKKGHDKSNKQDKSAKAANASKTQDSSVVKCRVCGKPHTGDCRFMNHPDANKSKLPWDESVKGKEWAAKNHKTLHPRKRVDGTDWSPSEKTTTDEKTSHGTGDSKRPPFDKKKKRNTSDDSESNSKKARSGTCSTLALAAPTSAINTCDTRLSDDSATLALLQYVGGVHATAHLMPTLLAITLPHTNKEPVLLQVNSLLDTGAISHNYMSQSLASRLQRLGVTSHSKCAHVVSSALSENNVSNATDRSVQCVVNECSACVQANECLDCNNNETATNMAVVDTTLDVCTNPLRVSTTTKPRGVVVSQCYDLTLMLLTNVTRRRELRLTFSVTNIPFDLIIGRQDILRHDITKTCREYFVQTSTQSSRKRNAVLDSTVVATLEPTTAFTQLPDVKDVAIEEDTRVVVGLTNETDNTQSVRPEPDFGIDRSVRQRSHPIHTAVPGYENEVILERRHMLLDVELAILRDGHLVTATCRVEKWATRSPPNPLIGNLLESIEGRGCRIVA